MEPVNILKNDPFLTPIFCILCHQKCLKKSTHLGPRQRVSCRLGTFDSAPTLVVVVVVVVVVVELWWWWWWCCCCTVVAVFVVVVIVVVEVRTECLVDVCTHINKVT